MFEDLRRKQELSEIKEILLKIGTKLDELSKYIKKGETPPKTAQKQVKMDISQ